MNNEYNLTILSYIQPQGLFNKQKTKGARKQKLIRYNMINMLRRTSQMFEWKNLPITIPKRHLELTLQTKGHVGIIEVDDKYYACWGGLGGIPNYNYMPMNYIISNPYLNLKAHEYNIYDDGEHKRDIVVIPNDSLYVGLLDILSFHSELLTEINLTKRAVSIWKRSPNLLTAPTNNAKTDLDDYLSDLEEGELSSIYDKNYLQNINAVELDSNGSHNIITQLLEMEQYQKAAMFNDLGMQMNYNMKRETITSSEAQLGEGSLLPLPDDMLDMRKKACEEVNKLFGLNWEVDFSSAWHNLYESIKLELEKEQKEVQSTEQGSDNEAEKTSGPVSESKGEGSDKDVSE